MLAWVAARRLHARLGIRRYVSRAGHRCKQPLLSAGRIGGGHGQHQRDGCRHAPACQPQRVPSCRPPFVPRGRAPGSPRANQPIENISRIHRPASACLRSLHRAIRLFRCRRLGYDGAACHHAVRENRWPSEPALRSCSPPARARACAPPGPRSCTRSRAASLLAHVLEAVRAAGGTRTAVVVGPGADDGRRRSPAGDAGGGDFVQPQPLGTAHAVMAAAARSSRAPTMCW